MSNNRSFAVSVELGTSRADIISLAFGTDGSLYVQDSFELEGIPTIYQILQIPLPVDEVGMNKTISFNGPRYYSKNKPKLSHHAQSGLSQISSANNKEGCKLVSGFKNGQPKGVGNYSFQLHKGTNDGGPIVAGMFWGLNNMRAGNIASSERLAFNESHLRDQTMNNRGSKHAVAVNIFHFPKEKNSLRYINKDWAHYLYRHYKRPLLTRIIDPGIKHKYLLGISCLSMRCNEGSLYGYRLGGGPGVVDQQTGNCLNTLILFEMPIPNIPKGATSLDFKSSEWS